MKKTQKAIALIKFFSEESHYNLFKSGTILFRTPHFYRCCNNAGRGDRNESCTGYWDKKLGDNTPNIKINNHIVSPASVLIYPAFEQKDSWLQSWSIIDLTNEFYHSLDRMIEEFGKYFVIMPPKNIKKYAHSIKKASGHQVRYGYVEYSDNPSKRSLTVKDSCFSYQKEFRFYLGECEKEELTEKTIKINNMGDFLFNAQTFKILDTASGKTKYYSLGQKEPYTT